MTGQGRPTIVGCVIARDEERFLADALRSLRYLCDRVVVVDTGSRDRTRQIALAADQVSEFAFDGDFSAARNHALSLVGAADWVVFLDADERLLPEQADALRQTMATVPDTVGGLRLVRYNFFPTGGFYVSQELRAFRFRPDVRYERTISESVADSLTRAGLTVATVPVLLTHIGHCRPKLERDRKSHRYIEAMQAELRGGAGRPMLIGYVGVNLRVLGRLTEARDWTSRAVEADPGNPMLWLFHGHVIRSLETADDALRVYERGLAVDGEHPALLNMAGLCHAAAGRLDRAADLFEHLLHLHPHYVHPLINLGMLAEAQGDYERAEASYVAAGQRYPDLFIEEPAGNLEFDTLWRMIYDTQPNYAGLARHLAFVRAALQGDVTSRRVVVRTFESTVPIGRDWLTDPRDAAVPGTIGGAR